MSAFKYCIPIQGFDRGWKCRRYSLKCTVIFLEQDLEVMNQLIEHSNFWIHDLEQATWVPTIEEVSFLKEVLDVTNEHNEIKRALGRAPKDRSA